MSVKEEWEARSNLLGSTQRAVLFKRFPAWLNGYVHRQHINFVMKNVEYTDDFRLLDLGCGYGRISMEILKQFPAMNLFGVELSEPFSQHYRSEVGPCFCGSVLDFNSIEKFNAILSVTLLMYLSEEERLLCIDKIFNMLNPGGVVVVIEPSLEFQCMWRKVFQRDNAQSTGGDVAYFSLSTLINYFSEKFTVIDCQSTKLFPFTPGVHHMLSVKRL